MHMKVNLKNKKSVILIIVVLVVIISLFSIFMINNSNKKEISNKLEDITLKYYNEEFVETMPGLLKRNGMLKITLSSLKQLKKDVSFFEKNKCDLENTYVILTYNEKNSYDIETHLDCD